MSVKLILILVGAAVAANAANAVPEIDSNSAVSAIALVAGGLMVLRGRKKR